jgi:4-hydroxy-tetrahydrodipicolinate reductase
VIGEEENRGASALTPPMLNQFDAVIDFTTPEAVIPNLRACLAAGARVVVGTTGWYGKLEEMAFLRITRELALTAKGYEFSIRETHHVTKLDKPSGTALSIQQALAAGDPSIHAEITSFREGDAAGLHVVEARSANDMIELRHEAFSRRGFAEGAVKAAEWLAGRTGCYEFSSVFPQIAEK